MLRLITSTTKDISYTKSSSEIMTTFIDAQRVVINVLITNTITRAIHSLVTQEELSFEFVKSVKSAELQKDFDADLKEEDTNRSR